MKVALSLLALLGLFAGSILCIKDKERMMAIAKACMEDNGSTHDVLRNFRLKKLSPTEIPENAKCGMNCFLIKSGLFNEHNLVNFTVVEDLFSELRGKKEILEALNECEQSITNPNICERAFQSVVCTRDYLDWD